MLRKIRNVLLISVLSISLLFLLYFSKNNDHIEMENNLNKMYLTYDEFLSNIIKRSPIIPETNHHRLMIAVVNAGMLQMTRNYLCSLKHSNISSDSFAIFAFDEHSYNSLQSEVKNLFYYKSNLSKKAVNNKQIIEFYRFLHFRTQIALDILKRGCDVITSDTDIVILSDFNKVFKGDVDLEAQHDSKFEVNPNHTIPAPWKLNLGFHLWKSSNISITIVSKMLEMMKKMPKNHDQSVLRKMTKNFPMKWSNDGILSVDTSSIAPGHLTVRYIDGLKAVNAGGVFTHREKLWKETAEKEGIHSPVLCHFFHLGSYQEKVALMKKRKLWFLNQANRCCARPPSGFSWPWWK